LKNPQEEVKRLVSSPDSPSKDEPLRKKSEKTYDLAGLAGHNDSDEKHQQMSELRESIEDYQHDIEPHIDDRVPLLFVDVNLGGIDGS
jgi:hypothetical protein